MLIDILENGKGLPTTIQASGGTISVNTSKAIRGRATLIYVKAATANTTFDFYISDKNNRVVRHYRDAGGTAEGGILRGEEPLTMFGKYTLTIENSSLANDTFDVMIVMEENP